MSSSLAGIENPYAGLLARTLAQLDADAAVDGHSARCEDRYRVNGPVTIGVLTGDDAGTGLLADNARFRPLERAWATDLSVVGIGMLSEHQVPAGMTMWVNVEALLGEPAVLPMRIIYCSQLLPNTFRVGAAFTFAEH
jgi:hypothetical protein